MVALGWHARRGLVVVTNAGHPPSALVSCFGRRMDMARNATPEPAKTVSRCAARPTRRCHL
jgi:hypothetical protein